MARKNETDNSLDIMVRCIVREELREMFSGLSDDTFGEPMVSDNHETSAIIESGNLNRRTRRKSSVKNTRGRVTNSEDKRLKANREANA